jgi:hypothetical protein
LEGEADRCRKRRGRAGLGSRKVDRGMEEEGRPGGAARQAPG